MRKNIKQKLIADSSLKLNEFHSKNSINNSNDSNQTNRLKRFAILGYLIHSCNRRFISLWAPKGPVWILNLVSINKVRFKSIKRFRVFGKAVCQLHSNAIIMNSVLLSLQHANLRLPSIESIDRRVKSVKLRIEKLQGGEE